MIRSFVLPVAACSTALVLLLVQLDRLCAWLIEESPTVKEIVLTPWFTAFALVGGVLLSIAPVVALALMFPNGIRSQKEPGE